MNSQDKLRVLLAEDHSVVRSGLRTIINSEKDMKVVGEAEDGTEVVDKTQELHPDLVLMDIGMPGMGGLEATRKIKSTSPTVKILILTIHETEECLFHALNVGADGYLTKSSDESEVLLAIRAVKSGRCYIDPRMAGLLVSAVLEISQQRGQPDPYSGLTDREKEMLPLIASGQTNKEIAQILHLSKHTVHNHRAHLMEKLGIHDRMQLLMYAIRRGIVSPQS